MLSIPHMIVVFLVVLVVFGPQKLPELAKSFGKLMAEFRKASNEFKSAFEEEMRDLERQARIAELKKQVAEANAAAQAALNNPAAPVPITSPVPPPPLPAEAAAAPEAMAPVISPVGEAVPRLDAGVAETADRGVSEGTPAVVPNDGGSDSERPIEPSPSHDQQQPA